MTIRPNVNCNHDSNISLLSLFELLCGFIISRVAIQSVERKQVLVQACRLGIYPICRSVGLSVSRSVWRVNCGKTADWMWMPFGW